MLYILKERNQKKEYSTVINRSICEIWRFILKILANNYCCAGYFTDPYHQVPQVYHKPLSQIGWGIYRGCFYGIHYGSYIISSISSQMPILIITHHLQASN